MRSLSTHYEQAKRIMHVLAIGYGWTLLNMLSFKRVSDKRKSRDIATIVQEKTNHKTAASTSRQLIWFEQMFATVLRTVCKSSEIRLLNIVKAYTAILQRAGTNWNSHNESRPAVYTALACFLVN